MRRATRHEFRIKVSPFSYALNATDLYIMIKQDRSGAEIVSNLKNGSFFYDPEKEQVYFTMSDTQAAGFLEGKALVQLKGKTNGISWATDIAEIEIKRLLSTDTDKFVSGDEFFSVTYEYKVNEEHAGGGTTP